MPSVSELCADFTILEEEEPDFDLPERIEDDDLVLRQRSVQETNDLGQLWDLFSRSKERVMAMDQDPNAFIGPDGFLDLMAIRTYKELLDTTRKMLETLNKMKNSDRVTASILDAHTKSLAENLAIPLGERLRQVLTLIDKDRIEAKQALIQLLQRGLVEVFKKAAQDATSTTKETYGLE